MTKSCKLCWTSFEWNGHKKYCSNNCAHIAQVNQIKSSYARKKKPFKEKKFKEFIEEIKPVIREVREASTKFHPVDSKICAVCGKTFKPASNRWTYCSIECREANRKKNAAERRINTKEKKVSVIEVKTDLPQIENDELEFEVNEISPSNLENVKIYNLTGHDLSIRGWVIIKPHSQLRLSENHIVIGNIDGVPIYETNYQLAMLPKRSLWKIYVVGNLVCAAAPHREDLYQPHKVSHTTKDCMWIIQNPYNKVWKLGQE